MFYKRRKKEGQVAREVRLADANKAQPRSPSVFDGPLVPMISPVAPSRMGDGAGEGGC
jgi:hypothetical protein